MKIAVCLIVFNGDPYIAKYLKHYTECPDVDYVCVSEGATRNMVDVLGLKTASSTDKTLEILDSYDDHPKVRYAQAFKPYTEKLEQQNAYMELVPDDTDYIWVADSDEFYHYNDINTMKHILMAHEYTWVDMPQHHFFKNINTIGFGGSGWGYKAQDRIFRYYAGQRFIDHRPMTILNRSGVSVKNIKPLTADKCPITCYHYSYITENNVYEKMLYYSKTFNRDYINNWYIPVWKAWTEENKLEIESKYSIHPTVAGAITKHVELIHPIDTSDLL